MSPLVTLIAALAIFWLLFYLINSVIPFQKHVRMVLNALVVIGACYWLIRRFHL